MNRSDRRRAQATRPPSGSSRDPGGAGEPFGVELAELKERLVNATRFDEVVNWFFDHLGASAAFLQAGQVYRDTELVRMLGQMAAQLLSLPGAVRVEATLFRLPARRFVHGPLTIGDKQGSLLYFEDIARGMLAVGDSVGPSSFVRFSVVRGPAGPRLDLH